MSGSPLSSTTTRLLTPDEVADVLRVSRRALRRMAADGILQPLVLGHRTVRYREPDVLRLLEGDTRTETTP